MSILISWWCIILITATAAERAVLDPALYLGPSPPMIGEPSPWTQKRIVRHAHDLSVIPIQYVRVRSAEALKASLPMTIGPRTPICSKLRSTEFTTTTILPSTTPTTYTTTTLPPATTVSTTTLNPTTTLMSTTALATSKEQESMEKAETFWPSLRTSGPYFSIHVPLSFSLSGIYGRYGTGNPGVISTSYVGSNSEGTLGLYGNAGLYGKSALAGSSYGTFSGHPGIRIYGSGSEASWSGWGNGKWGHYGKG